MPTTERLTLRPWEPADRDRAFDLYSRWEVARWLGAEPRALAEPAEADDLIARFGSRCTPDGRYGVWAVEVRETGVIAGTLLLIPIPDGAGEIEIGWHFHPDSWGHGYATEAATAVRDRALADGLTELYALVRPDNTRSAAVCHRLGMTPLGRTDRWYGTELEAFRLGQ
ncbi:GNAT family N-acetyltransferase [Kitasatospora griseola]|uniref:GNAT family N-acetyltransferase n=1 Tax=Kitasatospora griseola TaxID=2064 RepID=UPI0016716CE3|nr:GNAT family N-acetyltransferase [Kitasatospora griseola]GGQ60275.1 N-acetyltransferase [Kitasatospora griseola]